MEETLVVSTPLGEMTLYAAEAGVTRLEFGRTAPPGDPAATPLLRQAAAQLAEYFAGRRRGFELALAPAGTPFQRQVWQALLQIPYGETRSYGQIAQAVGRPRAARAVGMAVHDNPISIVIPCHRVIGASGRLVGFGGGIPVKRALLRLEGNPAADARE